MKIAITSLLIIAFLTAAFFILLRILFYIAFSPMRKVTRNPKFFPGGKQFNQIKDRVVKLIDELISTPCETVCVTSHDGLKLYGRYYERERKGVIEIDFHGYRGHAFRDYCGGSKINKQNGISSIIITQRSHDASEGNVISFGIKERYDVLTWVNYAISRFGNDIKIILSGVSMGAATVLMASELDLPKNVVGIIADCPYSSPEEIIRKVTADKGLPEKILYPLTRLSIRIFSGIDIQESSPIEAVKHTDIPILIIHGDGDRFVPYEMGTRIYEACASKNKKMLTVKGAAHALSYFIDTDTYYKTVTEFIEGLL